VHLLSFGQRKEEEKKMEKIRSRPAAEYLSLARRYFLSFPLFFLLFFSPEVPYVSSDVVARINPWFSEPI